ncbi:sulfatase-like hydrolase/transferase [Nibrella saemangeumensis]|uniref:Sulfatase-like hydrolase/transferase n=1 Tax=Nibrella saemangeumensis TaxID=1084526 RepID=A0ABP8ND81_9BACT
MRLFPKTQQFFFWLFISLGFSSLWAFTRPNPFLNQPNPSRPNIVFILADDLGWGDLSSFGAPDLRTPHIDSIINGGVKFTNFYANSPVCSPSRAALLSGRWPERMGVPGVIRDETWDSWGYLAPGQLLPNYLTKAGYHTALVGKWHLGLESPNLPNERGFQEFYGLLEGMMDDYVAKRRHNTNFLRHNKQTVDPPGHVTDLFTDKAVNYLNGRNAKANQPFFLYLAYTAPHDPLQPPAEYLDRVQKREPNIDPMRAKLVALIEHMDDNVGRVMATLKANGQFNNTLVIFTSDNGGWKPGKPNVGPYRGFKGTMYEGGIRISAGAMWLGHIQPGRVSAEKLLLMDWMPTLMQVAGTAVPSGLDATSFLDQLTNANARALPERPLYFVRREGQDTYKGLQIHALQLGDWKLLQPTPFAPYELYNLKEDPAETTDLFTKERRKADELVKMLMEHIRTGGSVPWQKPVVVR